MKKACCMLVLFWAGSLCAGTLDFFSSFVQAYEFHVSGKYGHEYHPALLEHTAKSVHVLEQALQDVGVQAAGRIAIMGYEENCIPNYFPDFLDFQGGFINDEAGLKQGHDWSMKMSNRFGLMTGFLLRTATADKKCLFEHVGLEKMYIFEPQMRMFQQDCFGSFFANLVEREEKIAQILPKAQAWRSVFHKMINFWRSLYKCEARSDDSKVLGTQDILFTVHNAQVIAESALPLRKFFVGPDLTYPITVSSLCAAKATENAQRFVQRFVQELVPVDGKKTLYVFKSFVDGVGKSTLLGNLKNYLQYGLDYSAYQSVDNTSSLFADVFAFSRDVFIADLPAQMSHFTFKPEGQVFVSPEGLGSQWSAFAQTAKDYFLKNKAALKMQFDQTCLQVKKLLDSGQLYDEAFYDQSHPEFMYIRNVLLSGKSLHDWTIFHFDGRVCLGQESGASIKVLQDLETARSEGLKNADPSQMLFYHGAKFPPAYSGFLQDLQKQAVALEVERVVFVDFLSMYSRSSRENVRVNYLVQMLGLLWPDFALDHTLYHGFTSNAELLGKLVHQDHFDKFVKHLWQEAFVREVLYESIADLHADAQTISDAKLSLLVKQGLQAKSPVWIKSSQNLVRDKLVQERDNLRKIYESTKEFKNIYNFDVKKVFELSEILEKSFHGMHPLLAEYFSDINIDFIIDQPGYESLTGDGPKKFYAKDKNGRSFWIDFVLSDNDHNPLILEQFLHLLRTSWYKLVANLVLATAVDGKIVIPNSFFMDQFLVVRKLPTGQYALVRTDYGDLDLYPVNYEQGELEKHLESVVRKIFGDRKLSLSCFANLGVDLLTQSSFSSISFSAGVSKFIKEARLHNQAVILPAEKVWSAYTNWLRDPWLSCWHTAVYSAQKKLKGNKQGDFFMPLNDSQNKRPEFFFVRDEQVDAIIFLARCIATMEAVMRDVESNVEVLLRDSASFRAAMGLVQTAILPQVFGLLPSAVAGDLRVGAGNAYPLLF